MSRQALMELLRTAPQTTAAQAAQALGITRQRVYQIAAAAGVRFAQAPRQRPEYPRQQFAPGLSSHFVGGASEMTVCAHLLRLGVPVYRACTFVSAADLIAEVGGRLLRIEVRSARVNPTTGQWSYPTPRDASKYDVLALVEHEGRVRFRPPLPD